MKRPLTLSLFVFSLLAGASANAKAPEPTVDLDYVLSTVRDPKKNVTSVETFLAQLPKGYRSSYAIMHSSRSIQEASYLNPRVIFSGNREEPMGKEEVVLSFNGGGKQFGANSLELMQWRPEQSRFELFEITFRGGAAKLDGPNPAKCMTCHSRGTQDVYPLWDTYFLWSGAYGSNDGHIKTGTTEDKNFRKFVAGRAKHPRYKYLVGLEKLDYKKAKQDYGDILEGAGLKVPGYFIFPATGEGLQKLNVRYASQFGALIAKRMQTSPAFASAKNLMTCALSSAYNLWPIRDDNSDFYFGSQEFLNARLELVAQRTAKFSGFKKSELRQQGDDSEGRLEVEQLTGVAWISQVILGQPSTTWSTAIGDQSLNMAIPHGPTFMQGLIKKLNLDPEAAGIDCDAEVANAVAKYPGPRMYGPTREDFFDYELQKVSVPQVALVCAACHASDKKHFIPFQNPAKLRPFLTPSFLDEVQTRTTDSSHAYLESMPYQQDLLSDENQKALMQYLGRVKTGK